MNRRDFLNILAVSATGALTIAPIPGIANAALPGLVKIARRLCLPDCFAENLKLPLCYYSQPAGRFECEWQRLVYESNLDQLVGKEKIDNDWSAKCGIFSILADGTVVKTHKLSDPLRIHATDILNFRWTLQYDQSAINRWNGQEIVLV